MLPTRVDVYTGGGARGGRLAKPRYATWEKRNEERRPQAMPPVSLIRDPGATSTLAVLPPCARLRARSELS